MWTVCPAARRRSANQWTPGPQAERGVEENDLAHVGLRAYDARRMDGLLERDRELAALDRLIGDAEDGRGRVALIEGPAGIGKSRLLAEARARARPA